MTDHVLMEKSAQLLLLTFNRPEKKNALTLYATLASHINGANHNPEIRCLLQHALGDMFEFAVGQQAVAARRGNAARTHGAGG